MKKSLMFTLLIIVISILINCFNILCYANQNPGLSVKEINGMIYYLDGDRYFASKYVGDNEKVDILSNIDGINVEYTSMQVFSFNKKIKEVTYPKTIKEIENGTFNGCINLEKVNLPNELKKIGREAFSGCYSLKSIYIPSSVEEIEENAFHGFTVIYCEKGSYAEKYAIENNLFYINDSKVDDNVFVIQDDLYFYYLLKEVSKNEIEILQFDIGNNYFISLEGFICDKKVTKIGDNVFNKKELRVYIPDSVEYIGKNNIATIYCEKGSYAEKYAINNKLEYKNVFTSDKTDIKISKWAKDEMRSIWYEMMFIPDVFYKKNDFTKNITREEFTELMINLYEMIIETSDIIIDNEEEILEQNPFVDTNNKEIIKAYIYGIIKGKSENTFNPNEEITREEVATIINRIILKTNIIYDIDNEIYIESKKFIDDNDISQWAKENVYNLQKYTIINGYEDNSFRPKGNTTIEQAIVMLYRMVNELYILG